MIRYKTYKDFKQFVQPKDTRTMDQICITTDFKLQAQQLFLKEYVKGKWDRLLLYHQIGSGKTCTSIVMAEEVRKINPDIKVKILLPARLRTNYIDELISPCGMEKYISHSDFQVYMSNDASLYTKLRLKTKFMKAIEKNYDILSFDKFKILAKKHIENLQDWIKDFTTNSLIIIDEAHNLMSDTYDKKASIDSLKNKKIPKGFNTLLMRFMSQYADPSCKMVFMTATPIFDNIVQNTA